MYRSSTTPTPFLIALKTLLCKVKVKIHVREPLDMILHFVLVALLRTSMHLKIRVIAKMNNIWFSNFFRENRRESHAPFVKTYATLGYLWNWTLYYKVTSDNEWCFDKKLGNEFYLIRLWFWLKKDLMIDYFKMIWNYSTNRSLSPSRYYSSYKSQLSSASSTSIAQQESIENKFQKKWLVNLLKTKLCTTTNYYCSNNKEKKCYYKLLIWN